MLLKPKLLQNSDVVITIEFRLKAIFLEAVNIYYNKHIYLILVKLFRMWFQYLFVSVHFYFWTQLSVYSTQILGFAYILKQRK